MSDIPEDVMKRASALLLDGLYDCVSIDSSPYHECLEWQNETAIAILAAALMEERAAERERCAKKCEGDFDSEMRSYGDWFAREIRGQP